MERWFKISLAAILIILAVFLPLASTSPDGLERVAKQLGMPEVEPIYRAIMYDYFAPFVENEYLSTLVAGVFGFFLVLLATWGVGKAIKKRRH